MRPFIHAVTGKTTLTALFVFALAASVAAAPQRSGGGGHSGGGHSGGGHSSGNHSGGAPRAHFDGGPHGRFGGPRGHFHEPHGRIIIGGGFYDPFWGPYYPYRYGYPYGYSYGYPYGTSGYSLAPTGNMKTQITPKQTQVYVDGYYAGVADDFDGAFQGLHTSPGGHAVTLRLDGYRTITQNIYVRPDSTYKLKETMEQLGPGETSEPVPLPTPPTGPADALTPDGGSVPQR